MTSEADDGKRGSVERVVEIISAFADGETVLGIKQLSERLGLPPATVHRVLEHLIALRLIERAKQRRYRIGVEFFRIAGKVVRKQRTVEVARQVVGDLVRRANEACTFALFVSEKRCKLVAIKMDPPLQPLRFKIPLYEHSSLVWGAAGRVMLAYLPPDIVAAALAEAPNSPLTRRRPPVLATLNRDLAEIRKRGYAIAYGELNTTEAVAISAAVFGPERSVVGSLTLVIPNFRFQAEMIEELATQAMAAAREIAARLGGGQPGLEVEG